ncbi:diguanylate cyclase (GGDEF)-like protein/PAS domain S-box-containing protein [Paucibacter oligotrophus]|uniref:Sensor protein FixL n=1 Tax=Roseateles oligotrophus TaxID=1769250 RepID=A0A840L9G9_9BURK|nr:EAL domain-containing protein [Roseateles oligotrophus]MBB4842769.1 diguanylate cyclase (GGDEF)-like protein/PAS domain S-box-containing protein [Roseateles oligotrophus]
MPTDLHLPARPLRPNRLFLRQWLALVLAWLLAWLLTGLWLNHERGQLRQHEGERLQAMVQTLDGIVSQQLLGVQAALKTMASALPKWRAGHLQEDGVGLLSTLTQTMPGVRIASVFDAQGRLLASSQPELVGSMHGDRSFFSAPQAQPLREQLYTSPPYRNTQRIYTMTLSRALFDAQQKFIGVAAIALDPEYFKLVLGTAQVSDDNWSVLIHSDGLMFGMLPQNEGWLGRNLLHYSSSMLSRHLSSGRDSNTLQGESLISGDERLAALHTVKVEGLSMNKHLVVAVGRKVETLDLPWRQQVQMSATGGLILCLASGLGLGFWQRRMRGMDELRAAQRHSEREGAERMALALEGADLSLWDWDLSNGRLQVDGRWHSMLGYGPRELPLHYSSWQDRLHPDDAGPTLRLLHDYLDGRRPSYTTEFRLLHKDGHWVWVRANGRIMSRDAQGRPQRLVGTNLDISPAKQAEQTLLAQAQHTQAILDNMVDGVITIDAQGQIASMNASACRMFGYTQDEVLGRNVSLLMPEPEGGRHDGYLRRFFRGQTPSIIGVGRDVNGRRKAGSIFPLSLAVSRIERDGQPMFIGLTRDITERKRAEAAIEKLAFNDPLTGLPNRRLLLDRLDQTLASRQRQGRHGAVVFIDLDNFKSLNDTLGHGMGDLLLQSIAKRLQSAVRAEDSVARWGGDEFVVLLQDLGAERAEAIRHAEVACEKLLRVLGQPYQLKDYLHHSTPSIGIVVWGAEDRSSEDLLKHADHAMYQAKAAGRNQLCFFDPVTQAALAERAVLEADLRVALRNTQFELHLQAQVTHLGALTGAEVLLRWRHPVRGWVSPAQFIPLAEQTGLIVPLGEWVLQQACFQLALWAEQPRMAGLTLAVNVSAHQFRQKGFLETVQNLLSRSGAPAHRLKLELTESALVDDVEAVIALMGELKQLGVKLSLDDFGTGYSSLAYLKRLPLKQLKIDQSFVRDLLNEPNARAIAHAILQLGESLGLQVIAEGVETEAQRSLLVEMGCLAFQGYLFSPPLPLADFIQLTRDWPSRPRLPAPGPAKVLAESH